jgi:serine/threonine protein kinase
VQLPDDMARSGHLEHVMARLARGDDGALGELHDALAPRLRAYLTARAPGPDAEAAIGSILLELYRNRGAYIDGADVSTWAFAFARAWLGQAERDNVPPELEVLDLVQRGFQISQVAAILGKPRTSVLALAERSRRSLERSIGSAPTASPRTTGMRSGDLIGCEFDKYRIAELLGSGAFGEVYRATHVELGVDRAIKVMREAATDDAAGFDRFRREAQMIAELGEQPNIVFVHDVGRLRDGRGWYAMEHLRGCTLAQRLADEGRLDVSQVLAIVRQVCAGLAVVHRRGIVHGDIKPANCFLVGDDRGHETVKILDFGVAKLIPKGDAERAIAPAGPIDGTAHYLAPEALHGATGPRTDVYAVGVMMFEMLTGRLPFEAASTTGLWLAQSTQAAPSLAAAAPSVGFRRKLEALVARALQGDPDLRFASIEDLGEALDALDPAIRRGGRRRASPRTSVRMFAVASASALTASMATAMLLAADADRLPLARVNTLTPDVIASTVATARPELEACHGVPGSAGPGARLLVLGATGQVIKAEILGPDADTELGECVQEVLFELRFPTFVAAQEQIEVAP